jgi:S1-C subfamily serine protease
MLRRILPVCLVAFLALASPATGRADDDKKTDADTKVAAAGTEISLTPAEVTVSDKTDDEGRIPVTVKPAKEAKKVKMPALAWALGFVPEKKDRGIGVGAVPEGSGLHNMRLMPGKGADGGDWQADPGDIITYANGYAVNTVEELICAISVAKNPENVQLVIKDVNTGKETVFYVTATKK